MYARPCLKHPSFINTAFTLIPGGGQDDHHPLQLTTYLGFDPSPLGLRDQAFILRQHICNTVVLFIVCTSYSTLLEVKRRLLGVSSLFPLCMHVSQGSNSGHQHWQQAPFPAEPSRQLLRPWATFLKTTSKPDHILQ